MNKNRKKIAAIIGAGAIGGAVTVAAIAQACGGGDQTSAETTAARNAVTELVNYERGNPNTIISANAQALLTVMELRIGSDLDPNSSFSGESSGIVEVRIINNSQGTVASQVTVTEQVDGGYQINLTDQLDVEVTVSATNNANQIEEQFRFNNNAVDQDGQAADFDPVIFENMGINDGLITAQQLSRVLGITGTETEARRLLLDMLTALEDVYTGDIASLPVATFPTANSFVTQLQMVRTGVTIQRFFFNASNALITHDFETGRNTISFTEDFIVLWSDGAVSAQVDTDTNIEITDIVIEQGDSLTFTPIANWDTNASLASAYTSMETVIATTTPMGGSIAGNIWNDIESRINIPGGTTISSVAIRQPDAQDPMNPLTFAQVVNFSLSGRTATAVSLSIEPLGLLITTDDGSSNETFYVNVNSFTVDFTINNNAVDSAQLNSATSIQDASFGLILNRFNENLLNYDGTPDATIADLVGNFTFIQSGNPQIPFQDSTDRRPQSRAARGEMSLSNFIFNEITENDITEDAGRFTVNLTDVSFTLTTVNYNNTQFNFTLPTARFFFNVDSETEALTSAGTSGQLATYLGYQSMSPVSQADLTTYLDTYVSEYLIGTDGNTDRNWISLYRPSGAGPAEAAGVTFISFLKSFSRALPSSLGSDFIRGSFDNGNTTLTAAIADRISGGNNSLVTAFAYDSSTGSGSITLAPAAFTDGGRTGEWALENDAPGRINNPVELTFTIVANIVGGQVADPTMPFYVIFR